MAADIAEFEDGFVWHGVQYDQSSNKRAAVDFLDRVSNLLLVLNWRYESGCQLYSTNDNLRWVHAGMSRPRADYLLNESSLP